MTTPAPIAVAAFYRFAPLAGLPRLKQVLQELCDAQAVRGILLVAPEGINGTLAGEAGSLAVALAGIAAITGIADFETKMSHAHAPPFKRMRVRIKKEIITLGDASVDPARLAGTYVEAQDWNALIGDPKVLLIDARNAYEVAAGTFAGAVDPGIESFGQFPAYVRDRLDPVRHRKVAMFCTGGIRCEKASSLMLQAGFAEVYHLKGGILKYLECVPEAQSRWQGGCFVFDERVAVGHGLAVLPIRYCQSCDRPLDADALQAPAYEEGVCCPNCAQTLTPRQKASARERQRQFELAQLRVAQSTSTGSGLTAADIGQPDSRQPSVPSGYQKTDP